MADARDQEPAEHGVHDVAPAAEKVPSGQITQICGPTVYLPAGHTAVGADVGPLLGLFVGLLVGQEVGIVEGMQVGAIVGLLVGLLVGHAVGLLVGLLVGVGVGVFVGLLVQVKVAVGVGEQGIGNPAKVVGEVQLK